MASEQDLFKWIFGFLLAIMGFFLRRSLNDIDENKKEITKVKLHGANTFIAKEDWRTDLLRIEQNNAENTREIKQAIKDGNAETKKELDKIWSALQKKADK